MTKKQTKSSSQKKHKSNLAAQMDNPTQKIHWALRLLREKGFVIGDEIEGEGATLQYQINGRMLSVQEIYSQVTRYAEWNDRLGLGTARLPKIRP